MFLRIQRYRVCRAAAAVRPGLYSSASSALSYALIMNAFSSWFMFFYRFDYRVKIRKMSLFSYSLCKLFSTFPDNLLRFSTNVYTGLPALKLQLLLLDCIIP